MRKQLLIASLFLAASAHADITHEVVSLGWAYGDGAGASCGSYGSEPVQLIESPDGGVTRGSGGYVVPAGYVLEVTDISVATNELSAWLSSNVLSLSVQNRYTTSRAHTPFAAQLGTSPLMAADDNLRLTYTSSHVMDRGTRTFSLRTGFLVSANARLCVRITGPTTILNSPVRIRGRLHPVSSTTADPTQPPIGSFK